MEFSTTWMFHCRNNLNPEENELEVFDGQQLLSLPFTPFEFFNYNTSTYTSEYITTATIEVDIWQDGLLEMIEQLDRLSPDNCGITVSGYPHYANRAERTMLYLSQTKLHNTFAIEVVIESCPTHLQADNSWFCPFWRDDATNFDSLAF